MKTKIVSVVAEGDLVIVATPREYTNPKDPSKKYTTTCESCQKSQGVLQGWDGA